MRPSDAHAQLWSLRHGPSWYCRHLSKDRAADASQLVDACVNSNADLRYTSGQLAASNLLAILRRSHQAGAHELVVRLGEIAMDPGTDVCPLRRAGFAKKWLRKILETSPRRTIPCATCGLPSYVQENAYSGRYHDYVGEDGCSCRVGWQRGVL